MLISGGYDKKIRFWKFKESMTPLLSPMTNSGHRIVLVKPYRSILAHDHMVSALCAYRSATNSECVISASWDKTVKIWDIVTGNLVFNLQGHRNRVKSLVLLPRMTENAIFNILFSADDNGIIIGWNLQDGSKVHLLQDNSNSISQLFVAPKTSNLEPHGERNVLYSYSDRSLRCWDTSVDDKTWLSLQIHDQLLKITSVNFICMTSKYLYQFYHSTINMQPKVAAIVDDETLMSLVLITTSDGKVQIVDAFTSSVYCQFHLSTLQPDKRDRSNKKIIRAFVVENAELNGLFPTVKKIPQSKLSSLNKEDILSRRNCPPRCTVQHKCCILYIMENGDLGYLEPTMDRVDAVSNKFATVQFLKCKSNYQQQSASVTSKWMRENDFPITICGAFLEDEMEGSNGRKLLMFGTESFMVCINIPISLGEKASTITSHQNCLNKVDTEAVLPKELPPILRRNHDNISTNGKKKRVSMCASDGIPSRIGDNPVASDCPIDATNRNNGSFWINLESHQYSFSRLKLYSRSSDLVPMAKDLLSFDQQDDKVIVPARRSTKRNDSCLMNQGAASSLLQSFRPRSLDPLLSHDSKL
jgi:hypothetical protein